MKEETILTSFEWDLLWMAIRYSMNGKTISTGSLPRQIMEEWYEFLTKDQKAAIVRDLKTNLEMHGTFGMETIDHPIWFKFMRALDEDSHYEIVTIEGEVLTVFEANDKIYSLREYIKQPYHEIYLPKESIMCLA